MDPEQASQRSRLIGMEVKTQEPTAAELYELDFLEWTSRNAGPDEDFFPE